MTIIIWYLFLIMWEIPLHTMYDDPHFYRATAVFYEPRFDRDWLATVEVALGGGSADAGITQKGISLPLSDSFFLLEAYIIYIQNLIKGFFVGMVLPVRTIEITPKALPPDYCYIPIKAEQKAAIGDIIIHSGYTYSYQNTTYLDFIDWTIRLGLLVPTSPVISLSATAWTIPIGYNGFGGIPISLDLSIGAYEWLTWAMHVGIMPLIPMRAHNFCISDDFFGESIRESNAVIISGGMFIKADHIMRGISVTLGYSYTQQTSKYEREIYPCWNIMNFTMHTLNLVVEYDFLRQEYWLGPRIACMYNHILEGRSIICTDMVYGQIGIELAWQF